MAAAVADYERKVRTSVANLWPDRDPVVLTEAFIEAVGGARATDRAAQDRSEWDETDVVLITYADSIAGPALPLENLGRLVRDELTDAFNIVHILPFTPSSSDRGFAPIALDEVDPSFGEWRHIDSLAAHVDLMCDLVVNHVSSQSDWFGQFLRDEEPGRRFFVEVVGDEDLTRVVRPRSLPLVTTFDSPTGPKRVWTTFSGDQVDVDWSDPGLVCEFLKAVDKYLRHGARILRLDAVAYLHKRSGSPCIHLAETHEVVRLLRSLLAIRDARAIIITETNVPDAENRSYLGDGDEAHAIYNFTLPPLLVDAVLNERADRLAAWLQSAPPPPTGTTVLNFVSSHDGIGVRPVEGIMSEHEIADLVTTCHERGGLHGTYDRDGVAMPYELNIALTDLFGGPDDVHMVARLLLAHSVMLGLAGIPAIYVNSLLATRCDRAAAERDRVNRSINRSAVHLDDVPRGVDTWRGRIFVGILRLAVVRRSHRAFHPDAPQRVSAMDDVLTIERTALDGSASALVIANFSAAARTVPLRRAMVDMVTGTVREGELSLGPFDTAWLMCDADSR